MVAASDDRLVSPFFCDTHPDECARSCYRCIQRYNNRKKLSLETRIAQAGFSWSRNKYIGASLASATFFGGLIWLFRAHPIVIVAAMGVGGFGFPAWILNFLRKRRLMKFVDEFPNAVDIIIRGVKAGLPLGDCLRVIATESAEPVRSEFRQIVETQAMGFQPPKQSSE
jgi:tight adherence protein B